MRALVIEDLDSELPVDAVGQRLFKIRAADTEGHRSSASILVNRRYAWRGYRNASSSTPRASDNQDRITLVAVGHDETIGTISIGFDGSHGLFVDDLFPEEVAVLRREGRKICEFTKLAMDSTVRSKRVLASLFHVAFIYAHRLRGFDSLLIEVNPRHVRYYDQMLGFKVIGSERMNQRVDAPAVLMCLDFSHAHAQIKRFGGNPQYASVDRSLYPHAFSVKEEAGIVGRLRGTALRDVAHVPVHSLFAAAPT